MGHLPVIHLTRPVIGAVTQLMQPRQRNLSGAPTLLG